MSVFDIRASDKGPGRARPPRTKGGGRGSSGGGGGGSQSSGCFLWSFAPPLVLLVIFGGLLANIHAP
jgi:hypothetical protein